MAGMACTLTHDTEIINSTIAKHGIDWIYKLTHQGKYAGQDEIVTTPHLEMMFGKLSSKLEMLLRRVVQQVGNTALFHAG